MASPQIENGFTRIANELMEAVYSTGFNGTQFKIILCIIRYTYGFKRKSHELSVGFISKATGVSRQYVSSELSRLIENKVVTVVQEHTDTASRILALNKNYIQWCISRTSNQQVKNTSTGELEQHTTDEELITTTDEELFTQERNNKEILKEIDSSTKDPALEFMNEVEKYYSTLTGRMPSSKDLIAITELANHTQDIQTVKNIMKDIASRYKPIRDGDKIKSFTYFVPGIKDRLLVEQKQKEVKPSGNQTARLDKPKTNYSAYDKT